MDSTIYASYDLVQVSTIVCALVFLYVSQKKMIVSLRRLVVKIQCTIKYKVLCNKCQSLVLSPQEKKTWLDQVVGSQKHPLEHGGSGLHPLPQDTH